MAATRTYKMQALVLRKTKLGERDLIITLLSDSGELVKAVAKGARKPGSSFAAKLDLFSSVDLMLAKGRSLDVVTDARFTSAAPRLSFGLETGACAAAVAELLSTVCQEGLAHPRLYEMAKAAFQAIAAQDAVHAIALADAALIKIVSSAGFRPNLDACSACATSIDLSVADSLTPFSVEEGGVLCPSCARQLGGVPIESDTLAWTRSLLLSTFDQVSNFDITPTQSFAVLQLLKSWIDFYVGRSLKSITYLFTCGLF